MSEKYGLAHTSKGIGDERFIVVTKPGKTNLKGTEENSIDQRHDDIREKENVEVKEAVSDHSKRKKNKKKKNKNEAYLIDDKADSEKATHEEKNRSDNVHEKGILDNRSKDNEDKREFSGPPVIDGKVVCSICNKDVLKANLQLHEIHCARKFRESKQGKEGTNNEVHNQKKAVSKSSKHRTFDKELAERVEKVDKDDIDALIETVQNMDNFCCFKKCKTSVQTLFQICSYCEGRYCLTHHIPEVHGCGDAARAQARARISKDGVLYRGSGVPDKRPDSAKKAHLQRKLDSKLTELASKRKGKHKN